MQKNNFLFKWIIFYNLKEWLIDKLWLLRLGHLADALLKMNKVSLSLHGKQLAVFVAKFKIRLFKGKLEFGKTCICHSDLIAYPQLDFSDEIGGITYKCDLKKYYIIKYVNVRKICSRLWITVFQVTNIWCYKIMSGEESLKGKIDQWIS